MKNLTLVMDRWKQDEKDQMLQLLKQMLHAKLHYTINLVLRNTNENLWSRLAHSQQKKEKKDKGINNQT